MKLLLQKSLMIISLNKNLIFFKFYLHSIRSLYVLDESEKYLHRIDLPKFTRLSYTILFITNAENILFQKYWSQTLPVVLWHPLTRMGKVQAVQVRKSLKHKDSLCNITIDSMNIIHLVGSFGIEPEHYGAGS